MHVNPDIFALLEALNHPSLPGIDLTLTRMEQMLAALEHPERMLPPVIHFAGTNGKGSTLAFLRAMYEAQGYKVHAYTSPHLVRFNERIVIAGGEIRDDYLFSLLKQVHALAQEIPVTFFEATTALAFLVFAETPADVLLLETGLGGRLDATNMVERPLATVITPIDYDHKEFLGDSLAQIAAEKAGIIKLGVPCFVGSQKPEAREVIKRVAREKQALLTLCGRDWSYDPQHDGGVKVLCGAAHWHLPQPALVGAHQFHNAALASVVARNLPALPVQDSAVMQGVTSVRWPARLQRLTKGALAEAWGVRGDVYLDGGHNPSAALALKEWIRQHGKPVVLVWGMMARKDAAEFMAILAPELHEVIAVSMGVEGYDADALARIATHAGVPRVQKAHNIVEVVARLDCGEEATLLIAGSLFLAADVLKNHS